MPELADVVLTDRVRGVYDRLKNLQSVIHAFYYYVEILPEEDEHYDLVFMIVNRLHDDFTELESFVLKQL